MSTFNLVVALCLGLPFLTFGSPKECMTTVEGFTWDYDENIDELIIGVDTVDLCYKTCADDNECQGYTWTNSGVVQLCYKFKHQLLGYHDCVACSSGVLPHSLDGACVGEYNDILDVGPADNIEECMKFCFETDGCQAYTWWDNTSSFLNTCFLYGGCEAQGECEGCVSGRINCIFTGPNQCVEYMVLDDAKRSVNYIDEDDYCDDMNTSSTSYDWHGPGYYRIMSTAGTRLPESSLGRLHCGTLQSGWLWGKHHQAINAEKKMTVCFHSFYDDYDDCYRSDDITVTFCDGFYVYMLPNVPVCDSRYCVSN